MGAMFRPPGDPQREEIADASWAALIPEYQWDIYLRVIRLATQRCIPFAIGGGFAFSHYSRRWRNTKDIDLYVVPDDRDAMIEITRVAGLADYYSVLPYDRRWIYRSFVAVGSASDHPPADIIVDIMWQMANYRAQADGQWLSRGDLVSIRGWKLRMLPAEELLWSKLYILQKDRCDWGDLLNILYSRGSQLDWDHLVARVGDDKPVLAALVQLFTWACPGRALALPRGLWNVLGLAAPTAALVTPDGVDRQRVRLLDSRDWFGPTEPAEGS